MSRNNGICPIHKKGNVMMCDNYRPVTFLCTTYKSGKYFICKLRTLCWRNNRKIPRSLSKEINCW